MQLVGGGLLSRARAGPHRCWFWLVLILAMSLAASLPADQQQAPDPPKELNRFEIGGLLFGDAYWVASNHEPADEGIVSAWMRRGYLTFDSELTKRLSGRMRFELNQDGDFDVFEFEVDFKDLYLQTAIGEHRVLFGLSPTPTYNLIEKFWGYRYVERTPMDVQGVASRDTGIAANGPIAKNGSISYRVMYGTQLEFGTDSNDAGEWMAAVSWEPNSNWVVELYGDFEDPLSEGDGRRTLQGFLGYRTETTRLGLQYSHQDRDDSQGIKLASLFGVVDFSEDWSLLARVDRLFEPSVRGDDIAYLPFDPDAKATLLILGVEARPYKFFSLIPNIEYIHYDDLSGPEPRPEDDLLVRLTFNLTF